MQLRTIIGAVLVAALTACGGGGGGSQIPLGSNSQTNAGTAGGSAASAPSGARTWTVNAGASHRDGALQALDFFNESITIDVGDSVTWTSASLHTVSFLEGSNFTPFTAPPVPAGSSTEDGSTFTSSGILGPGQTYTLTFTKAGTYVYYCLLHPPEMVGTIIVQPAGTPYPHSQGFYTGQGNASANNQLAAAQASIQLFPFADNGTTLAAGISPGLSGGAPSNSSVWRFLDAHALTSETTVTIPVNGIVTWVNESNNEPHTVTLPVAGQPLPPLPGDPFTPPMGIVINGVNIYDGTQVTNSGPFGTAAGLPTNSYSLKFTKAGTYKYFCLFHDALGMEGTVIVQ